MVRDAITTVRIVRVHAARPPVSDWTPNGLRIGFVQQAAVPVLAIITLRRALKAEKTGDFSRHRRIARWTLPIWLYVSVTGVLVYWMLY